VRGNPRFVRISGAGALAIAAGKNREQPLFNV
jgi:hypothetical protein